MPVRSPRLPRRQQGMALIMVLLAFALVGSLAAGMLSSQSLMIYKASHYLDQRQARGFALGGEAFARQLLYRDWEDDDENNEMVDDPGEFWAANSAALPVKQGAGAVEMQINDLQGKINLNDLVDANGKVNPLVRDRLDRLIGMLPGLQAVNVDKIIDWIDDNDQVSSGQGAEDGIYLGMNPPYRAANFPFVDVSELRLIDGMTPEGFAVLKPHVSALPAHNQGINVNFASIQVIQSLVPKMTFQQAKVIYDDIRDENKKFRFENVQDFIARPEFAGTGIKKDLLRVDSNFMESAVRVNLNGQIYRLVTKLYRNNKGELQVISRDAGETSIITKPLKNLGE
ncbi:type II secretion system minor pseudopilin GspK [Marinobacteraceae bacterium S3BR75-40.1]